MLSSICWCMSANYFSSRSILSCFLFRSSDIFSSSARDPKNFISFISFDYSFATFISSICDCNSFVFLKIVLVVFYRLKSPRTLVSVCLNFVCKSLICILLAWVTLSLSYILVITLCMASLIKRVTSLIFTNSCCV